jgi:hypothetical protein
MGLIRHKILALLFNILNQSKSNKYLIKDIKDTIVFFFFENGIFDMRMKKCTGICNISVNRAQDHFK